MKVSELPLNDLYAREKITSVVEAAIIAKEDFSTISQNYCQKVCKLQCKDPKDSFLKTENVDVLIIQDYESPDGKYDKHQGQTEERQKDIIEFIAKRAGFNVGVTTRIANLLKCPPNDLDFPNGTPPTITKLMKCRPYLYTEIETSKPKVIISLSTAVTKALGLTKCSNTGNRGEIVQSRFGPVVITLHPRVLTMIRQNSSGAMWGADYFRVIQRDFEKAFRLAKGELTPPSLLDAVEHYKKSHIEIAESLEDVSKFIERINSLPSGAVVSFDTETTGLDPMSETAKLLCIQFGWINDNFPYSVVIPLWHRENKSYDPAQAWNLVVPLLLNERPKIGHNVKFDILYIYHTTGIRVQNVSFDTMLVLHSLDSGTQGCYGLKDAVGDYLPEMGLTGYETLLPSLTKEKKVEETEEELQEVPESD